MPSLPTYRATANSSPPIRATTSVGLVTDSSRWAASRSTRSPVWWPQVSFTSLKESRSRNSTSTRSPSLVGALEQLVDQLDQTGPVHQSGERVVSGLVAQAFLRMGVVLHGGDGPHQQQHGHQRAGHRADPRRDLPVVSRPRSPRARPASATSRPTRPRDQACTGRCWTADRERIEGCRAAAPKKVKATTNGRSSRGEPTVSPWVAMLRVADVPDQDEGHGQAEQPERGHPARRGPGQQDRHEDHHCVDDRVGALHHSEPRHAHFLGGGQGEGRERHGARPLPDTMAPSTSS